MNNLSIKRAVASPEAPELLLLCSRFKILKVLKKFLDTLLLLGGELLKVSYVFFTLTFDIDLDRIGGSNVVHIGREILNYSILFLNWRSFTERWYGYWRQIWRNLFLSKRVEGCDCKSLMILSDEFYDSSIALILYYNNINPVPTKIFCDSNKIMLLIKQNKILFL